MYRERLHALESARDILAEETGSTTSLEIHERSLMEKDPMEAKKERKAYLRA